MVGNHSMQEPIAVGSVFVVLQQYVCGCYTIPSIPELDSCCYIMTDISVQDEKEEARIGGRTSETIMGALSPYGCGAKLNSWGKPQVEVFVSVCQRPFWVHVLEPQPLWPLSGPRQLPPLGLANGNPGDNLPEEPPGVKGVSPFSGHS